MAEISCVDLMNATLCDTIKTERRNAFQPAQHVPFKNGHGLMTSPLKFESVRSSSAKQQDYSKEASSASRTPPVQ
jgi:hypothetical protein